MPVSLYRVVTRKYSPVTGTPVDSVVYVPIGISLRFEPAQTGAFPPIPCDFRGKSIACLPSTVSAFPPLAGKDVGKSVICDFV